MVDSGLMRGRWGKKCKGQSRKIPRMSLTGTKSENTENVPRDRDRDKIYTTYIFLVLVPKVMGNRNRDKGR